MIEHRVTVRNRIVHVDRPQLVQGCVGSDVLTLDLDPEWDGLNVTVAIGSGESKMVAEMDGEPMTFDVGFPIGYVPVFVSGVSTDGSRKVQTIGAPKAMYVVAYGGGVE